jgi:hypothetical protein
MRSMAELSVLANKAVAERSRNPLHNKTPEQLVGMVVNGWRVLPASTSNALYWGRVDYHNLLRPRFTRRTLDGKRRTRKEAAHVISGGYGFLCAVEAVCPECVGHDGNPVAVRLSPPNRTDRHGALAYGTCPSCKVYFVSQDCSPLEEAAP